MPTWPRSEIAVALASALSMDVCSRSDSVIWRSMRTTGFSDVIGSWNTIAIFAPHRVRSVLSSAPTISVPSKTIEPLCVVVRRGSSPIIERERTVLPDPDSPTMPSVSPRPSSRDTPSTARTRPRGVANEVLRSVTLSRSPWVSSSVGKPSSTTSSPLTASSPGRRAPDAASRRSG